ncbi:MAG: hypothetical protein IT309_12770 [Anaerolineales bacterium]|nr:hypothetical protein [Anaerolineales bacterium]
MTQQTPAVNPWTDDENIYFPRPRMKTFWNLDYFERIILPLLDFPHGGQAGSGGGRSVRAVVVFERI